MNQDLVDIQDLMTLLGYSDERSIKRWCKARGIPIVSLGLKRYVLQHYLTQYIDNQLVIFDNGHVDQKPASESENKKAQRKTKRIGKGTYDPGNEIIAKYLTKYESSDKPQTTKKR